MDSFLKNLIKDEETVNRFTNEYYRYIKKGNGQPKTIRFCEMLGGSLSETKRLTRVSK
jgi:hypothetical protein